MAGAGIANLKTILFLAGGVSAGAVGTGYVIKDDAGQPIIQSIFSGGEASQQTAEEKPAENDSEVKQEVAALPKESALQVDTEQGADAVTEVDQSEIPPPTFDLLRVERDGSVVIAGRAPANSKVEIVEGGNVLASGKSGPGGEFAIVFDDPLSPGSHELSIRATPVPDGGGEASPVLSAETGVVVVPEKADGQGEVLAMVQQPGAATRVLHKPEPVAEPAETTVADVKPDAQEEPKTAEAADSAQSETETAAAENDQKVAQADAGDAADVAETQASEGEVVASKEVEEPRTDESATELSVQAVDVEPNKVFIAGSGNPGAKVQVYIDNAFKGVATIGPEGGFLFEMPAGLTAGQHDLRIDEVDGSGAVKGRVAVVVDHQVEQQVAAVDEPVKSAETPNEPQDTVTATAEESIQVAKEEAKPEGVVEVKPMTLEKADAAEEKVAEAPTVKEQPEKPQEVADVEQTAEPVKTEVAAAAQTSSEPETVVEETASADAPDVKVIKTGKSVIIRRGDNLWRISRRMLGQGRKYTVIFEANANVIKDPNIIFPGQVFDVPDQVDVEGEEQQG